MRLVDLEPLWLLKDGRRVGFVFRCPTRPTRWQSCFYEAPPRQEQWRLFAEALYAGTLGEEEAADTVAAHNVQGCTPGTHWTIEGEFENLSCAPSLDGSKGGNWHGYITNGEIVGGLPG